MNHSQHSRNTSFAEFAPRPPRGRGSAKRHRLPVCATTGLARYRDRHQARAGATGRQTSLGRGRVATFACPECQGYHLETVFERPVARPTAQHAGNDRVVAPEATRRRRYFLVDIENLTRGARVSTRDVRALWRILSKQAPGVATNDHVVVGAARRVVRRYSSAITGGNVRWVVGADVPDGADQALLAAVDLRRVAREFDELVIASGDHAFTPLAMRARQLGLPVQAITVEQPGQRTALSRALSNAVQTRSVVRASSRLHLPVPAMGAPALRAQRRDDPTQAIAAA